MEVKKILLISLTIVGFVVLTGLSFLIGTDWGNGASWSTAIYGLLISFFLCMQIYGFVYSQIKYQEDIEETKFSLLEIEGILLPFESEGHK